ncbi:alkaline phosphatase [Aeromicrobium sp. CTD01-1L150]|uniref:alkaline phosphatase n=1 Tax=Aeromicrobium sp. CTD01-1L150 TaxID=3341830 RepID=UPI0035C1AE54
MNSRLTRVLGTAAVVGALALAGTTAIGASGGAEDRSAELASKIDPQKPRNVILIIGDGMDDSMITAARNYELGADGRFALDELPFTGAMTTHGYKVGEGPDYPIAYVSDSAPTASAWSTGKKTVDSRVSQGPSTDLEVPGEDYETVLQKYRDAGKRTGNVSTAELTDATPAAAATSINNRACQGPEDLETCTEAQKANGGKGSIAEQLVDNEIDVILGGGAQRFAQEADEGGTVSDYATEELDYNVVSDRSELDSVGSLEEGPILGLFSEGNMTPHYEPLVAQPGGAGGPDTQCSDADRGDEPSLSEMTGKAIELLDNKKGFFLQTESAMIDKQEHASDICGAIGDLREIDATVKVALEYQKSNPDTLIIVTADHAHSTQIVGSADGGKQTATVRTADGDPLTVAYSTQDEGSAHTGSQIRVAASGPQAANVTGTIDQTDLFGIMARGASGTKPTPPPTSHPKPTATLKAPSSVSPSEAHKGVRLTTGFSDASKATLTATQGRKKIATEKVSTKGGSFVVKLREAQPGKVTFTLNASGKGGKTTTTKTVRVTKR